MWPVQTGTPIVYVTRKDGAKLFPSASAVIASNRRGALMNR